MFLSDPQISKSGCTGGIQKLFIEVFKELEVKIKIIILIVKQQ